MRDQFTAREPAVPTILVDDDRSRVTRWDFAPGAETGWHKHAMHYVVVVLTDSTFAIDTAEGEQIVPLKAGTTYARPDGIEHNVRNGGDAPMAFVEIEFKR
ncbi:MAG: cupin domain-containing protein [Beijerinckiaceae bacterium]